MTRDKARRVDMVSRSQVLSGFQGCTSGNHLSCSLAFLCKLHGEVPLRNGKPHRLLLSGGGLVVPACFTSMLGVMSLGAFSITTIGVGIKHARAGRRGKRGCFGSTKRYCRN